MAHGLLYLGSEVEQLYRVERGGLAPVASDTRFETLSVVADFVEETLVRASLPKMFGRDMQALVQRRLEQEFRETPYRAAMRLGASRTEKQLDFLFVGLPIAKRLDERLRPLVEQGVAVRGIYTPSMLVAHWARRGRAPVAPRLVVLPTPAGVRFVLLDRSQAVLSRLTSGVDPSDPEGAPALAEEIERTVQYFYNARLVDRGQRIEMWVWGSEPACQGLRERELAGLQQAQGPADARLGDPTREGMRCLLRLAAEHPPAEQLAPDAIRRFHALARLRRGLLLGGASGGLLLALVAAWSWYGAADLRAQRLELEMQATAVEEANTALRERIEAIAADPQTVAESIRAFDTHLGKLPELSPILVATSRAFDAESAYRLDTLVWSVADPPRIDPMSGLAAEAPTGNCPLSWPANPLTGERPVLPRVGLSLSGEFVGDTSLRQMLDARQRFDALLGEVPGFSLQTQSAAVDSSGTGVLRGGGEEAAQRAFNYCLSMEPPP
ncbi:hypothetical protein [Pseudomarimonas salicorniae]|uniref:Tfp pilus assembly protein, ATPase PilM n=1 Tax=Pseudomarimonas salicorniae TaxID=2933270 RepID=A0ABT0GFM1_9GAMM|nr:hypothetical protein [Lysobacter sp. CAU 1642]MCK7592842.1 hypothetical protein [Lysobacter sp. CAU 1642]